MREPKETEIPWDGYESRDYKDEIYGENIDALQRYPVYRDWNKITLSLLHRSITGASSRLPCFFVLCSEIE